ncbi:MAG: monovalent cation/H+ antiporter complex subunit F [Methanocorpusculum sp.]|nr:monovalent cation/H+ antiporter complex subunit F [Methanocorpusculum sp.]
MIELSTIFLIAAVLFAVLIIVTLIRLLTGKTTADKMLALDVINVLVVITMLVLAAAFMEPLFIDIAVVYALLSFVATIYIGKYLAGGFK